MVKHNCKLLTSNQELGCIQFISPGEFKAYAGAAGQNKEMTPTFCIHTFPLPFSLWRHYYTEGAHVVTPSIRHIPPECIDPKIKCRSRMHWWLADQESHIVDQRAISLCLDLQGNVAETSGSNFLMYTAGTILSPTTRNILPGVSSHFLKQLAVELGIDWIEKDFQVYDVINAEEAFLASTPYCIAPVTKINSLPISNGQIGPVFKSLIRLWGDKVKVNLEEQILQSEL